MKNCKLLKSEYHLDWPEGFRCRFITSDTEKEVLHTHEYYEIFLTLTDRTKHSVNGSVEFLRRGTLVFIRPSDVHSYGHEQSSYSFINLSFSGEIADSLFLYLGKEFPSRSILSAKQPPKALLSEADCQRVQKLMRKINSLPYNNSRKKNLYCKSLIATLCTDYFARRTEESEEIPKWLSDLMKRMQEYKYFSEGLDAMVRLSGKTQEHLSRSMKKYCGQTTTEFINNLRLNHAANLIMNSNLSVTDICFESGFNNTGWFFTCFKKQFGVSPTKFKKMQVHG